MPRAYNGRVDAYLTREGRRFALARPVAILGRDAACHIHIDDPVLSRQHAWFVETPEGDLVLDYKSRNGVWVNDKKVERSLLADGDEIRIGNLVLQYRRIAPPAGTTTLLDALGARSLREAQTMVLEGPSTSQTSVQRLLTLYQISKVINSELALPELLEKVMDQALEVMRADRGLVMLRDPATGRMETRASRAIGNKELEGGGAPSLSIVNDVTQRGEPVLTADAMADQRFGGSMSIVTYNIRSAMCVPLRDRAGGIGGVIYVDNRAESDAFSDDDLKMLSAFADQAAIAVENARLVERMREEERLRTNLQRYLSPQIAEMVLQRGEGIGQEKVTATILFADIRAFTPFAESHPPDAVVKLLNTFLGKMTEIVFEHWGTLDKYTGDGVMALFGVPFPIRNQEFCAVRAGLDMQAAMDALRAGWAAQGLPRMSMGIAIHTGEVIAGNFGPPEHVDYTAIGDAVNTAARIEGVTPADAVVVSEATYRAVEAYVVAEPVPTPALQGKTRVPSLFRITALREGAPMPVAPGARTTSNLSPVGTPAGGRAP